MLTFSIGTDFDKTNNTIYTCNYLNYPYCLSLIVFAKLACIIYNLNAVNHQSTFQTATHQLNDKVKMFELIPESSSTFENETLYHIYVSKEKIFLMVFCRNLFRTPSK